MAMYRVLYQIENVQRNGTRAILNFLCGLWTLEKDVTCDITRHEGAASRDSSIYKLKSVVEERQTSLLEKSSEAAYLLKAEYTVKRTKEELNRNSKENEYNCHTQ